MKTLVPFLIVATAQFSFCFDLATYKADFLTRVAVPYKEAVTVAATNIIEYLAVMPVPTTADVGQQVAANLNSQSQALSLYLALASANSNELRQWLDNEVENLVAKASGVQSQIASTEQQLQQVNGQMQQTNAQLIDAIDQVNAAQQSVQDAENALRGEEDRVRKAEHCTFIGGWLGKHICQVVNHDGIRRAEGARDNARGDLQGRQQRLAQYQSQLGQLQQQQANLQGMKSGFEATKNQLNAQFGQLNQARDNGNNVDIQLKAVIVHMGTLFGKSEVLVDVIRNLIDMETVINPLTAISDQIVNYTQNADDITYLNTMKQRIAIYLPIVQQKLSQYALIPPIA